MNWTETVFGLARALEANQILGLILPEEEKQEGSVSSSKYSKDAKNPNIQTCYGEQVWNLYLGV